MAEKTPVGVTQVPGPTGTAGVHPEVKVEAYNITEFGAVPVVTHLVNTRAKVLHMSAYAAELECTEKNTRHWMHR